MSYARFYNTDIYAFADTRGGYTCCWCLLAEPGQGRWMWEDDNTPEHDMPNDFHCDTLAELKAHVEAHVEAGDNVGGALDRIEEEIAAGCPYDK